jgi:Flp pilus assembly protein TadD
MNSRSRLGASLSTIAVAAALSGCAVGQQHRESIFGKKVDHENIGLATRALAELNKNNLPAAVDLAEDAVENSPRDAGFRALLGNCYFASGRFASAEQAYRDSLSLIPSQPQVVLKLALVQIAQGKNSEALAALEAARGFVDPADYGLAVALAGQPGAAVEVLNQAARAVGADGRVRQNLALAYGLSGDWTMARTIAAQDVPPEQLDSRIQQWMAMATPTNSFDQVAALTGVRPVADPGQPERLALNRDDTSRAFAQASAPEVQPAPEPEVEIPATPPVAEAAPIVAAEEIPVTVVAEATQTLIKAPVQPAAVEMPVETPSADVAEVPLVPAVAPKPVPDLPTRFDSKPEPASYVAISDEVRKAAKKASRSKGRSNSVVQLGAYSSPERVNAAWQMLIKRYPALAGYTPMRARFQSSKGTVWRLSIKGFESDRDARDRCEILQGRGGKCFVRKVAGDAPVQFASR